MIQGAQFQRNLYSRRSSGKENLLRDPSEIGEAEEIFFQRIPYRSSKGFQIPNQARLEAKSASKRFSAIFVALRKSRETLENSFPQ